MITYKLTKYLVLILLDFPTIEIVIANIVFVVKFYNKSLIEACSKLRVESVCKI